MRAYTALFALSFAGCQLGSGSEAVLTSTVSVAPAVVAAGDTVTLVVSTTNHGDRTVEAGYGCGEGLDFEVTRPDGSVFYVLRELPWTSPLFDSNVIEPGETDTVRYRWKVPNTTGDYRVRGGIRVESGIDAASAPKALRVQ